MAIGKIVCFRTCEAILDAVIGRGTSKLEEITSDSNGTPFQLFVAIYRHRTASGLHSCAGSFALRNFVVDM